MEQILQDQKLGQLAAELGRVRGLVTRLQGDLELLPATEEQAESRRLSGAEMVVSGGSRKGFWDLYKVGVDSFRIRGTSQVASAAWIAGVKKSIAVSGVTWDTDHWESGTVAATEYVYLSFERSAATVTLTMATTLPEGSDTVRIFPLWYVPWIPPDGDEDGYIDRPNIVDLRWAMQIEAMA